LRGHALAAALVLFSLRATGQPVPDPEFDTSISEPAHVRSHPRVFVDEAHFNYHTIGGRYRPFAELVRNDGFTVSAGTEKFTRASLSGADILVIANARGGDGPGKAGSDAFTAEECAAVEAWVRGGGNLLLIADHEPFGAAAQSLGVKFGVHMGKGHVFDAAQSAGDPSFIAYTRANGMLRDHAITRGRHARERIDRVVSFDGQSLEAPAGAVPLLVLGPHAKEAANTDQLMANIGGPVAGRAQGIALTHGRGRVVVMAEAAMFSAQIYRPGAPGQGPDASATAMRFGMNVPGNDDRQFVLNVMRWLSGVL
jgi:hypothetical protein